MTRLQFTGMYDAEGNPETIDPSVPTIETKRDFEAKGIQGGAQINQQAHSLRLQQGQQGADEAADAERQLKVDQFVEHLDRLQSVTSAGRTIEGRTLENLQHELNDTALAYVRMGGGLDDDELVNLRSRVDAISTSARRNK